MGVLRNAKFGQVDYVGIGFSLDDSRYINVTNPMRGDDARGGELSCVRLVELPARIASIWFHFLDVLVVTLAKSNS